MNFDGSGMGMKASDLSGAYGCSACHDAIDKRVHSLELEEDRSFYQARALVRTYERLFDKEVFKV